MSRRYISFALFFLLILAVLYGISAQPAYAKPYDESEAGRIRAFLECNSMVAGETNAELLGADPDDPSTWPGVSWIDYVPDSDPVEYLENQHVLHIQWQGYSLAGNVDISGFQCLQSVTIDNYGGTVGWRGEYPTINISGNPLLLSVYLRYISAGPVNIASNPLLEGVVLSTMDANTLTLQAPRLRILTTSTMGGVPFDFNNYPNLEELTIQEVNVIENLSLDACANIEMVYLYFLDELESVSIGARDELVNITIFRCSKLTSLDVSNAPKLLVVDCDENASLAAVAIGGNPELAEVIITENPSLQALQLTGLPKLETLRCFGNTSLEQLSVISNPVLELIDCHASALTSLDLSGLSALRTLEAMDNQLTTFSADGVSFYRLNLEENKLTEVSAVVGGSSINMQVYKGKGGYVEVFAFPDNYADPSEFYCDLGAEELPEPYDTFVYEVEGSGWSEDGEWDDRFTLSGSVEATVYFSAVVMMMDYFEDADENPYGAVFGVNYPVQAVVGDPIGSVSPSRDGFVLEGWYTDEELTQSWDLENDIVEGYLVLYPCWVAVGTPYVISVERQSPEEEQTDANSVTFLVTFSEVVSGVTPDDFILTTTGTVSATIDSVSASVGDSVEVTVINITGDGTLRLDVKDSGTGIMDNDENTLSRGYTCGETYTIGLGGTDECFIATAAFGSKFKWPVVLLRQFRDQYLLSNPVGTAFVKLYYYYSPPIAKYIAAREELRFLVRICLAPMITMVYFIYHPMVAISIMIWLVMVILYWLKKRGRKLAAKAQA